MAQPSQAPDGLSLAPGGRRNRSWKNILLDRRFQLKYAGYFVAIASLSSVSLGVLLWWASSAMLAQSQALVVQSQRVVEEGSKVSEVVRMSMADRDEAEEDSDVSAALQATFAKDDAKYTAELLAQKDELTRQAERIRSVHRTASVVIVGLLLAFVGLVGVAGIYVTHKVAGPIYKMKRQLREVRDGKLRIPTKLRKGDELVDFFNTFEAMVRALRGRQQEEIDLLEAAVSGLRGRVPAEQLVPLEALLVRMKEALDLPSEPPGAPSVGNPTGWLQNAPVG